MALLPDELLGDVLCLASSSDIASKIAVSQVSRHWRRVALNSPLLWTRIYLSSERDCSCVPLVLERCGPSALLEIEVSADLELWGPSTAFEIDELSAEKRAPLELESAMHALEVYASRICVLDTAVPTEALLNVGLAFPALRTLRVRSTRTDRFGAVVSKFNLRASGLRVLELEQVELSNLGDLLCGRLRVIRIAECGGIRRADLLTVFARCVDLVHLSFRSDDDEAHPVEVLEIPQGMLPLRHLRTLELRLPIPLLLHVLDSALREGNAISSISVTFPTFPDSEDLSLLYAGLPFRPGEITALEMPHEHTATLRAASSGLSFSLRMLYTTRKPAARLWPCISAAFRAHETVRELSVPLHIWAGLAEDFSRQPPEAVRTLRVLIPVFPAPFPEFRQVALLDLRRVEFRGAHARRFTLPHVERFMRGVICDPKRKLAVLLEGHKDFGGEGLLVLTKRQLASPFRF